MAEKQSEWKEKQKGLYLAQTTTQESQIFLLYCPTFPQEQNMQKVKRNASFNLAMQSMQTFSVKTFFTQQTDNKAFS